MHHEIYIDESCQNGHHYMVLGGIVFCQPDKQAIVDTIQSIRKKENLDRELKWGKISNSKLSSYKVFLDQFFNFMHEERIAFHSLVIDCHQLNHRKYNNGDFDIGFSKFVYQLLLKIGRECNTYQSIHAYLDNRTTKQSLNELQTILNNGIAKRHKITHRPFKRVQFINSKQNDFIQIVDLLIGAIGYQFNGKHELENSSPARLELIEHICSRTRLQRLNAGTPFTARGFTIWNMALQPR